MSYLRIKNFWDYQNADAWKKARENKNGHKHPAWCKLHVKKDFELEAEKPMVRLVFYELLKLATIHSNAIPNDSEAIAKAISIAPREVSQAVTRLLEGAWLCETSTKRFSREPSRKSLDKIEKEIEKKKTLAKRSRDEIWDALAEAIGPVSTESERGRRNKAVKELRAVGATNEEVLRRCSAYKRLWPAITLTATGLVNNWSALEGGAPTITPVEDVLDLPEVSNEEREQNLATLAAMMRGGLREVS